MLPSTTRPPSYTASEYCLLQFALFLRHARCGDINASNPGHSQMHVFYPVSDSSHLSSCSLKRLSLPAGRIRFREEGSVSLCPQDPCLIPRLQSRWCFSIWARQAFQIFALILSVLATTTTNIKNNQDITTLVRTTTIQYVPSSALVRTFVHVKPCCSPFLHAFLHVIILAVNHTDHRLQDLASLCKNALHLLFRILTHFQDYHSDCHHSATKYSDRKLVQISE